MNSIIIYNNNHCGSVIYSRFKHIKNINITIINKFTLDWLLLGHNLKRRKQLIHTKGQRMPITEK